MDGGAAEGDPRDLPPPRVWSEGWQLGTPDLVIALPQAYTLPAEGSDVFRIFALPIPVETARFVRGLEFRPGNARVVHHANIRIDTTPASRRLDEQDPAPGYDGLIARSAIYPDGHFLGLDAGAGRAAAAERSRLASRPAHRSGRRAAHAAERQAGAGAPSIGLYFGDRRPPTRTPAMLRLGRQNIDIPAGDARYTITDSYVLPVDVEVEAVQPHAHYRCATSAARRRCRTAPRRPLIAIKDWDFRWQHVYRFVTPLRLPKGTTLSMRYVYDNSAANPRNPQQPPARARWGQRSSDEMGDLWIQVLTRGDADLARLNRDFRPKVAAEDVRGYEVEIEKHPADTGLHDDAALLYLELGRADEAIAHFKTSLALQPQSAAAHYNLGTALTVARRLGEAADRYREALRIDPAYANAHNNLGNVYLAEGQVRRRDSRVQRGGAAAAGVGGGVEESRGGVRDGRPVRPRRGDRRRRAAAESRRADGERDPRPAGAVPQADATTMNHERHETTKDTKPHGRGEKEQEIRSQGVSIGSLDQV